LDSEHRFRSSGDQPTAEGQPLLLVGFALLIATANARDRSQV
jgi:hypothetical protein